MHTYTTNEETKKVLRINSLNKNQGAYKWPSSWKLMFKILCFRKIWPFFQTLIRLFWTRYAGKVHMYVTTKEVKKRDLRQKVRIRKKQLASKWLSTWNLIFKKYIYSKYDQLFSCWFVPFEALLGWECGYVCHDFRTGQEGIYILLKFKYFIQLLMRPFWPSVKMTMWIRMSQLKNWKKAYKTKGKNMTQAIGIQVTFMLENKLQKYIF